MEKIISIPFYYEETEYYTLVRVMKCNGDHHELRITIMNGELQTKLYGNDSFIVKDGKLQVDIPSESITTAKLKIKIAEAINSYFDKHPMLGSNSAILTGKNN